MGCVSSPNKHFFFLFFFSDDEIVSKPFQDFEREWIKKGEEFNVTSFDESLKSSKKRKLEDAEDSLIVAKRYILVIIINTCEKLSISNFVVKNLLIMNFFFQI
jgi:glycyl-tRNA synthetase alpha subunit